MISDTLDTKELSDRVDRVLRSESDRRAQQRNEGERRAADPSIKKPTLNLRNDSRAVHPRNGRVGM